MIKFINNNNSQPFSSLINFYNLALNANQNQIEAIHVSSFNNSTNEVNSRLVNLKIVDNDNFIFFSNYNSSKGLEFSTHNQVAILFFWPSINVQIRMKAKIKKTSRVFNKSYFKSRKLEKNALAISSRQSKAIESFDIVKENYKNALMNEDLESCPHYWGGYSFTPYEIEFWEGSELRLNKRNLYKKNNQVWNHIILEP